MHIFVKTVFGSTFKKYQDLGRPRYVIGKQFKENFKLYFLASMVRNTRFEKVQSKSQVSHHAFRA